MSLNALNSSGRFLTLRTISRSVARQLEQDCSASWPIMPIVPRGVRRAAAERAVPDSSLLHTGGKRSGGCGEGKLPCSPPSCAHPPAWTSGFPCLPANPSLFMFYSSPATNYRTAALRTPSGSTLLPQRQNADSPRTDHAQRRCCGGVRASTRLCRLGIA